MNILMLLALVAAPSDLSAEDQARVSKLREIQASEIQRYENLIDKHKQRIVRERKKRGPKYVSDAHRNIKYCEATIKSIKRGGVPPIPLELDKLAVGDIGYLKADRIEVIEVMDGDRLFVTTKRSKIVGKLRIRPGARISYKDLGRIQQLVASSGKRVYEKTGDALVLEGWGLKGKKEGDRLRREERCLVEVKEEDGCWVLAKMNLEPLRKYLKGSR